MLIFEERHGSSLFDRYRRFGGRIGVLFRFEWWIIWDKFERDVREQNGHTRWPEQHVKGLLASGWLENLVWESLWATSELAMTTVYGFVRGDRGRRSVKKTGLLDVTQFIGQLRNFWIRETEGEARGVTRRAELGVVWGLLPCPFEPRCSPEPARLESQLVVGRTCVDMRSCNVNLGMSEMYFDLPPFRLMETLVDRSCWLIKRDLQSMFFAWGFRLFRQIRVTGRFRFGNGRHTRQHRKEMWPWKRQQ